MPDDAAPHARLRAELGTTGLRRTGGWVDAEFLPQLKGLAAYKAYSEMATNDPTVAALLFAIKMLIRGVEWQVEAADATAEARQRKDLVEDVLFQRLRPAWADVVSEICSMFTYGYAPLEVVWAQGDDGFHPRKIALRSQETLYKWEFDEAHGGQWAGLWQQDILRPLVFLPRTKLLLFRTETELDNPEGRSILRGAYVPWVRKKAIEEAEGRAAIRAAGLVVVRVPQEVLTDESYTDIKAAYITMANNLAGDRQGSVLLPSEGFGTDAGGRARYNVEYVVADGRRPGDMSGIIERIDKRIATTVMADFLLLGQQAVGSFALSSDKTVLFQNALWGWLTSIAAAFNTQLLEPWAALNGWDLATMPRLEPGEVRTPNLQELGTYVAALASVGMPLFPDENLEAYLRTVGGLPTAPAQGSEPPTPLLPAVSAASTPEAEGQSPAPAPLVKRYPRKAEATRRRLRVPRGLPQGGSFVRRGVVLGTVGSATHEAGGDGPEP